MSTTASPYDAIPLELRELSRWVGWRFEGRGDKKTKVPKDAKTGANASSTDPSTWATFEQAQAAVEPFNDGIGFILADGGPYFGIDLDNCLSEGTMAPWAAAIVKKFDGCYIEISPSGQGVKIIGRGLPHGKDTGKREPFAGGAIEIYFKARFFTTTGKPWGAVPAQIADCEQQANDLLQMVLDLRSERRDNGKPRGKQQPAAGTSLVERTRKYVAKLPPAISGQGGHDQTFEVACVLFRFGLSDSDAAAVLAEYNQRCEPAWSEFELDHKLADAKAEVQSDGSFGSSAAKESPKKQRPAREVVIKAREPNRETRELPPEAPSLQSEDGRTDHANARRFVLMHGRDVRWVNPWGKWLVWDGRRWEQDHRLQTEARAKQVADAIWAWAADNLRKLKRDEGDEVVKFARYSANARGLANMLALARSETGVPVLPEQLDAHPYLFNANNGTIDLKTGSLLSHDRGHLITKICPIDYAQGEAGLCPLWEDTLDKIFAGSSDLIGFVRRLFGSAMAGEVVEHILAILWGAGSNGKSLIVETLLEVFGEYAGKAAPDLLLAKKGDTHPTEKADLFGKRLVFAVETDDGRRLAEATIKELTGGDTIKARRMREDFWDFRPSHTFAMVTNHRPRVRGQDHGLWRRLRLVPFAVKFWTRDRGEDGPPELEADKHLKEKLRAEYAGVLRWLVDACREWQQVGLGEPAEVRAATDAYKAAEDVLAAFISECCTIDLNVDDFGAFVARTKASDLRKRLGDWAKESGEKPISAKRLGEYLADRGIEKHVSNGTYYNGIAVL